jgi:hypothetical protein
MSLSLRHWLADHHIEFEQLGHQGAQIAGIAFRIVQEMEVKSLNAFAISALNDVLELPLKSARLAAEPISQLTVGLLRMLSRKKPLMRNEGTWLTFQVAYLNALQGILKQESHLGRPWLNRAQIPYGQDADHPLSDPKLLAMLKTLRPGRLSENQAEQALSLVADSFLVQQMNNLAIAWFVANGAEETEAKLLAQRLSNGLPGYILAVIAENALPLAQLQKFVRLGNLSSLRDTNNTNNLNRNPEASSATLPINLARENYRAGILQALSQPLLAEPFSLKDLYIPLKGRLIRDELINAQDSKNTLSHISTSIVDLMEWVLQELEDRTSVTIIEANSGCGKTSFCQMFAAKVASEIYPNWMPVFIRLRDAILCSTLEQTLDTAEPVGRFSDQDGWLSPNSPPCLLILDGLDELPRSPQKARHLWTFMEQLSRFNSQHVDSRGLPRHKIILTSRRATLDYLIRRYRQSSALSLPTGLRRIVIEPMGQEEFRQWFSAWAKLQSKTIAQLYFSFLKHGGVFQQRPDVKDLADLAKRPLTLYLLGILHRDAWIDDSIFKMGLAQLKFEVYDRICRWLLGEPQPGSGSLPEFREGLAHATRSSEAIANLLQGLHPQELRHQMQVAALTIIQSGQYQAFIAVIQERLNNIPLAILPALFFRSGSPKLSSNWELGITLPNLPSSLPLITSKNPQFSNPQSPIPNPQANEPKISFSHRSLGEYLAAEEIADQLQALTKQVPDQYGEVNFAIQDAVQVAGHLYALLGYGLLSNQIENLTIERLRREQQRNAKVFSFSVLLKRLYRFYRSYCRGQWIDEGVAHQAHYQLLGLNNSLNVLQLDAAVGINVFVLLCSVAKEAQIPFWPCGNPQIPEEFDNDLMLSFISRCAAISPTAFWQRARDSLAKLQLAQACLNQVMLAEANLSQANLSGAELIGINLASANLQNANLFRASLVGANLSHANLAGARLEGADLSGANLTGVTFTSANLTNACLFGATLDDVFKNFAIKSGAIFSLEDFQTYNLCFTTTKVMVNHEDEDILEGEPTIFIESIEGEPILPDNPYSYIRDEYEGDTARIENISQSNLLFPDDESDADAYTETVVVSEAYRDEF